MNRAAFKMKIKSGQVEEYKKRHDKIWPELVDLLRENGVSNYSIFFDEETHTLFAFQNNIGSGSQDMGSIPIVQKWWAYMADIMETNLDNSPISKKLEEVFYLK
jgi:L-rhamnose mutarotase